MKKIIYTMLIGTLGNILALAQVGVNNQNPQTTLDIQGQNPNGAATATDGILIPRVNALPITGNQMGQLLYLADGTSTQGFYYWDGTSAWVSLSGSRNSAPGWSFTGNAATNTTAVKLGDVLNPATTSYIGPTVGENINLGANGLNQLVIDRRNGTLWGGGSATDAANFSWGADNNITGAFHMKLLGGNNTAQNAKSGAVLGTYNTVDNTDEIIVFGHHNTIGSGKHTIVAGLNNTAKEGAIVMGQENTATTKGIVMGHNNNLDAYEGIVLGEYLDTNGKKNVTMIGTGVQPSGSIAPVKALNDYETVFAADKIQFTNNTKIGLGLLPATGSESMETLEAIKVPANNTIGTTCTPGQLVFDTTNKVLKGCITVAGVATWKNLH